jgi:nitrogen fixation protein FixH
MTMSASSRSSGGGGRREVTGRKVLLCLVAFFTVVGGVNAVLVVEAVSTFGGLETVNAYQAGLAFASEEAAAQQQEARHWRVNARLRHKPDGATAVELTAQDRADRPLTGLEATVQLTHPTNRRFDHSIVMHANGAGRFRGTTTANPGQWDLVIELSRDGHRMFRSKDRISLR